MMRYMLRTLPFLAIALLLGACEETADIVDVPYRERLVVYGVLSPGAPVDITFTRTLPLNEEYSEASAALADVTATLSLLDGSGRVVATTPLVHTGSGHYGAPGLTIASGEHYRLDARWRERTVWSTTRVPEPPIVDSVDMVRFDREYYGEMPDTPYSVRAFVRPRPREVYLVTSAEFEPGSSPHFHDTYGAPLARLGDTAQDGRVVLVDRNGWYTDQRMGAVAALVIAYDEAYYEFQRTYYMDNDQGPFGTGSDNVKWTVTGDGIGLFTARATTERRVR